MEEKMDLARVQKKIAEARFFLGKITEQERRVGGDDREPFDFYLSAFLSAARTVDYRLRHEQAGTYPAWRTAWDARLTPQENSLIKFMVDDRNIEVHESGSSRSVDREGVELGIGEHRLAGGMHTVSGPPDTTVVIQTNVYNFTIDGAERKATEACAAYLTLLQRMAVQFEIDHP
jgi:hypothetical protein